MDLLIDDREDHNLHRHLTVHDLTVTSCRLDFGDARFEGNGPTGRVQIGIERKHLGDLVQCVQDRRLTGHQLRGMWSYYDYCYFVLEDMWRPSETGGIEILRGHKFAPFYAHSRDGCTYRQVVNFLNSLEISGGVVVLRTGSVRETAALYASLLHWWDKEWKDHHSHDSIYAPGPDIQQRGKAIQQPRDPGIVEKMAAQLPGIDRKAWLVGERFETPADMLAASEADWLAIEGIGPVTARAIRKALYERPKRS